MWVGGQRHAPAALPPAKTRYTLYRRLGGPQSRSGQLRKISPPTGFRSPDRSARSQSLYLLSYPGSPCGSSTYNICRKWYEVLTSNASRWERDDSLWVPNSDCNWEGPPFANSRFWTTSNTAIRCAVGRCHGGNRALSKRRLDNSRAHEERVTALNSKRDRFAKWVTVLNRYSRPSAHVPRVIWPWTPEHSAATLIRISKF